MDISQDSVSSTISLLFDSSAELELLAEELEFFALELLAVELELFTLELELLADELEFFALELELFALEQELFALELELLADELEFFALESEFFTLELLSSSPQSMKSRGSESPPITKSPSSILNDSSLEPPPVDESSPQATSTNEQIKANKMAGTNLKNVFFSI